MKRLLAITLTASMLLLTACGTTSTSSETEISSNTPTTTEDQSANSIKDEIVNTWKIQNNPSYYYQIMVLYEGGTGKGFSDLSKKDSYYPLSWEIVDNVVNISNANDKHFETGYKLENGVLTSVDGEITFSKYEIEESSVEEDTQNEESLIGKSFTAETLSELDAKDYISLPVANYKPQNGYDGEWKILYSNSIVDHNGNTLIEPRIYLITSDYIKADFAPYGAKGFTEYNFILGSDARNEDGWSYIENSVQKNLLPSYLKQIEERTRKVELDYENLQYVAQMLNTEVWDGFTDSTGFAEYAIGGATYDLFVNSYNEYYDNAINLYATDNVGYYAPSANGGILNSEEKLEIDNFYVIASDEKAKAYWLASPATGSSHDCILHVSTFGYVLSGESNIVCGFRPVVCLNSNVKLEFQSDGSLKIVE